MSRNRFLTVMFALLTTSALLLALAGCGGGATPAAQPTQPPAEQPKPAAETRTVVIGFTTSITGKYNVESTRQVNGLKLWMEDVNKAGGIKLADGTVLRFDFKSYDDESNTDRVQELYTRLATEDGSHFLISPYSSGLTAAASVIAEQYEKVMVTTGAASDSNYTQGFTGVYQVYTPASHYLTGAIDMLMTEAPDLKRIAIVHENDKFSTDVSTALKTYAESEGYEIALFEGYDSGTTDFAPFINKIQEANPEAILGGGHFQDGSTFARQLKEKNVAARYIALLVAPPEPTFAELGDAAVAVIGPSQWEPLAAFTPQSAKEAGLDWAGVAGSDFTQRYQAAYGEEPSYHAAGGYAAGLVLQKAIEVAGSTDSAAIKAALDKLDVLTFFGRLKFEPAADAHGLQIGHDMVYIQWQKDAGGNLVKQVVWPKEGRTANLISR